MPVLIFKTPDLWLSTFKKTGMPAGRKFTKAGEIKAFF